MFSNVCIFAQSAEVTISYNIINDTAFNASLYIVRTNTTIWNLGTSSFVFSYNNIALTNARLITKGIWDNASNNNYGSMFMATYNNGSAKSLEIDYLGTQGNGSVIPATPTLIGTVQFHIANPNAYHNMSWMVSLSAVFDDYFFERTSNITFTNPLNHLLDVRMTSVIIPKSFELYQNYPNPFNSATLIKFDIPKASYVQINLYDISGKKVCNIINNFFNNGAYSYLFEDLRLASGIYYYKMSTGNFSKIKKFIIIK